jgi:hypothetical protein
LHTLLLLVYKIPLIGWGNTQTTEDQTTLKGAQVTSVSRKECNDAYGSITDRMICASDKGKGMKKMQVSKQNLLSRINRTHFWRNFKNN